MTTQEKILQYIGKGNRGLVAIVDAVDPNDMDRVLAHVLALLASGTLEFTSICTEDWMRSRVSFTIPAALARR